MRVPLSILVPWACALLDAAANDDDEGAATGIKAFCLVGTQGELEQLLGTTLVIGGELTKMLSEALGRPIEEVLKAAVDAADRNELTKEEKGE